MKFFLSIFNLKLGRLCICLLFLMLTACGDDDDRGPASSGVVVTGLEDDETTRKAKTWTWDCEENDTEVDCVYRYAINEDESHDFDEDDDYENTKNKTTDDGLNGTYYIHVQAKSGETKRKSEVTTASVKLDNTLPNDPDPSNFDAPSSSNVSPAEITVKNVEAGDIVRIYVDGGADEEGTQNSGFLRNVWNLVSPVLNLTSTETSSDDSSDLCIEDNEVGKKTVASGKTEVTIDIDAKVSEHEYYATITDEAGNKSACVKVFTYENIFVPEPAPPTACPSFKLPPHWQFAENDEQEGNAKTEEGLCRPSCGTIARIAGYSSAASVLRRSPKTCEELDASGYDDWVEFEIEDGDQTISSNDVIEVAERGGVCCGRGAPSGASPPPTVTGLTNDSTPGLSKTLTWGCDISGCLYRHAINKYSDHTFPETTAYTNTITVTKTDAEKRTKYYLHVQARHSDRESDVESVSFTLHPPIPPKVTGLTDDSTPKVAKEWRWDCDKGSCTYRYAVNQNEEHTFTTNETYDTTQTTTKQITNSNENGTYYLHVQAEDADGNESEVKTVLAILEISTGTTIHVTGLRHDTNAGRSKTWDWDCDKSSCTYRYKISQRQDHVFTNEDLYSSTQTIAKSITTASENGAYYLHVQAKDSNNNESEIETVVAILEIASSDVYVTGLSHDTTAGQQSKTWTWGCNKSSCTYRSVVNQSPTHTFSRSASYGSTRTDTKSITSTSADGTYYLHVQARDTGSNESEVETVLVILEVAPTVTTNVLVTGLSHDTRTGQASKTWNWNCNKSSCTYRSVVNQNRTHTFSRSVGYTSTRTATESITSVSENGTYYLHVQARDSSNNLSNVETVLVLLEVSEDTEVLVTGLAHDDIPKTSKTWNWDCNKNSCTYRSAITQNQNHTFSSRYGSTQSTTKTINSANENGVYYLHVQARDTSNNESEVKTVIALLEISADGDVHVTGLEHDTDPKRSKTWNWGCDKSSCTYRSTVNQNMEHTFSNSDRYGSTPTATYRITSSSQEGTYYLHVQARDSSSNESDVESVLVILRHNSGIVGDLRVTGVEDDIKATNNKTWRWYCTNNSGACTYRHVVNQIETHSFPESHEFDSTQMAEKTANSDHTDNGTYYLHVQAQDANGRPSATRSVVAYISYDSVPLTPGVYFNCIPSKGVGKSMTCTWSNTSDYRYIVNDRANHVFGVDAPYSDITSVIIDVANGSYDAGRTYYLHVQGKDEDGNLSSIETDFITLTEKNIVVNFVEDETKKLNKLSQKWTWECDEVADVEGAEPATKPCVYRYTVNQDPTHEFDNDDAYTSTDTFTKTLVHKDESGTYYIHVQTKDANNNVSIVKTNEPVVLAFELDLALKDPVPHTETMSNEEVPTSLQLHLDKTPTFTLRGVLDNHKVILYSSSECTDGSNDDNGDPTKDTRISSEVTMSSGQVDITISNNEFSDLTTYPIYVGVKESSSDDSIECYGYDTDSSTPKTPVIVNDDTNSITNIAPLFEYTLYNPIAGGVETTCYLSPSGEEKCWGNGTETPVPTDIISSDKKAKAVVVGGSDSNNTTDRACIILSDDTVKCNGGFLPAGNNSNVKVKRIALGASHACSILKEDNSVYCDGATDTNNKGQLGTGVLSSGAVNLGCDGASNSCDQLKAKDIVAGDNHTCIILLDENENNENANYNGRVLCWGYNVKGQLGQNDTLNHGAVPDANSADPQPAAISTLEPINLGSGRTAKSITAGQNHTCALLDNNTVKCWGHNILGQLGQNNVIDYGTDSNQMSSLGTIPLGISASSIFTGVGSNHTCAVLDNNTVKCWGNNWKGQLGQSDNTNVDIEIGQDNDGFFDGSNILINRNHGSGRGSDVPLKPGESRSNVQTRTVSSSLPTIRFGCNNAKDRQGDPLPCTSASNFKLKTPYSLAVGKDHVCAVLVTDQNDDKGKDFVKCWGSNDKKQLGQEEDRNYGGNTTDTVEKAPFLTFPSE